MWIPAPNIFLNVNQDTTQYSVSTDKREGESYSHGYYEKAVVDGLKNPFPPMTIHHSVRFLLQTATALHPTEITHMSLVKRKKL